MKLRDTIWALALALVICVTAVRAQDQQQNSQSASPISPTPSHEIQSGGSGYGKPPAPAARGVSSAVRSPTLRSLAGRFPITIRFPGPNCSAWVPWNTLITSSTPHFLYRNWDRHASGNWQASQV